jgi:pre-mRNA-splicing helicase BRR2
MAEQVLQALAAHDPRAVENRLVELLDFDKFELIRVLLRNRAEVFYCTRLKQAQTDAERAAIEEEMRADTESGGSALLARLHRTATSLNWEKDRSTELRERMRKEARALSKAAAEGPSVDEEADVVVSESSAEPAARHTIDLDSLSFKEGSHLMPSQRVELPPNAWRRQAPGFEEVNIPALKPRPLDKDERLVRIDELPEWARPAFKGMHSLNRIQSRLHHAALSSPQNLLVCAPTGAGKTNVAVLTMLQALGAARRHDGTFNLDKFKVVYIAPMKALV